MNIDVVDSKGCTPLIVACQYGKTVLAGYLMGKGARREYVDKDGDTALHWAAFKGTTRWSLVLLVEVTADFKQVCEYYSVKLIERPLSKFSLYGLYMHILNWLMICLKNP